MCVFLSVYERKESHTYVRAARERKIERKCTKDREKYVYVFV